MAEKGRDILANLSKAIANANDSQKEYLAGFADGVALSNVGTKKPKRKRKVQK